VRVVSTSDAIVQWNEVVGSTFDGIAIDGQQATTQGNRIIRNRLTENSVGIGIFGANAVANEVLGNRITFSLEVGLYVAGDGNYVAANSVTGSGALDVENIGANGFRGNRCESSSGPPVDCP
jgi:nitrous oxidase accessory protein NosD